MLRLPPFRYLVAESLAEAAALKAAHGERAAYVAGGTDLFTKMKRRQETPELLIQLDTLPELRGVSQSEDGGARIGASTRIAEIARDPWIREAWPALSQAAARVATPAIRNRATLGGNLCLDTRCSFYDQSLEWRQAIDFCLKKDGELCRVAGSSQRCWAIQCSDTSVAMIALRARFELSGPSGSRLVDAHEFYADDGVQYLRKSPDELLTAVVLPNVDGARAAYVKVSRRLSFDFPVLSVAVQLSQSAPDAPVQGVRLVLGAVGSAPLLVPEAAEVLEGMPLSRESIEAAAEIAGRRARPLDNADGTGAWRKRSVRPFVRRALLELMETPG